MTWWEYWLGLDLFEIHAFDITHEYLKYFIKRKKILVADYKNKTQNETNIPMHYLKL